MAKGRNPVRSIWLISIIFTVASCASTKGDFKRALETDTIYAYENFVTQHPGSEFEERAQKRIEELIWQEASKKNTSKAYGNYLSRYPNGGFAERAKIKSVEAAYSEAKRSDTLEDYEKFIERYPETGQSEQARATIEEIKKRVESAWQIVRERDSLQLYRVFIKAFPGSKYEERAKARLTEFELEKGKIQARIEEFMTTGMALERNGRLGDALMAYQKVIKLDPDYPYAYARLAYTLQKYGYAKEARQKLSVFEKKVGRIPEKHDYIPELRSGVLLTNAVITSAPKTEADLLSSKSQARALVYSERGLLYLVMVTEGDNVPIISSFPKIGVGSELRFDRKDWVDFLGEKYRKGGVSVNEKGIVYWEGTECLRGARIFVLTHDKWVFRQQYALEEEGGFSVSPRNGIYAFNLKKYQLIKRYVINLSRDDVKYEDVSGNLLWVAKWNYETEQWEYRDGLGSLEGTGRWNPVLIQWEYKDGLGNPLGSAKWNLQRKTWEYRHTNRRLVIYEMKTLPQLQKGESVSRAPLHDASPRNIEGELDEREAEVSQGLVLRVANNLEGLIVVDVAPESPAERAGIRRGDIIDEVNGKEIRELGAYADAVEKVTEGKAIILLIVRNGIRVFVAMRKEQ